MAGAGYHAVKKVNAPALALPRRSNFAATIRRRPSLQRHVGGVGRPRLLTPTFTLIDWIYVSQHVLVLGIALLRRPPQAHDYSLATSATVVVSSSYPYAQVALLGWVPGHLAWPTGGLVLVMIAAFLSLRAF